MGTRILFIPMEAAKFFLIMTSFMLTYNYGESDLNTFPYYGFDDFLPPIADVLEMQSDSDRSIIVIIDDSLQHKISVKDILPTEVAQGIGIFLFPSDFVQSNNNTDLLVLSITQTARKLRKASRTTTVVIVSRNFSFLVSFGKWSLERRLLGSETKLLVVSRLTRTEVDLLLESSWTYSMMDAMVTNIEGDGYYANYNVYCHLPYTSGGENVTAKLAHWTNEMGLQLTSNIGLFPPKFENFYGFSVPVTALSFAPYWIEEKSEDRQSSYSGTDFSLLKAIAYALNFTIDILPVNNWSEVTRKVELRESFVASILYMLTPSRASQYDFTFVYEFDNFCFSFARPQVSPQWQSLVYPLSHRVWIFTFGCFLAMLVFFIIIGRPMLSPFSGTQLSADKAFQELFGIILGQNLSSSLPRNLSGRTVVGSWLIFAFIVGSVYRGNLVAYLTLPKYPPRPETINELVEVADRVTMPSYGQEFKDFFSKSESPLFRELGSLLEIIPSLTEGLKGAASKRESFLDSRRYQEYHIAKDFKRSDGITQLYILQEVVSSGQCGWPLPHDAPYEHIFSWMQMAVIEAGLYEQWNRELMRKTKMETQRDMRRREKESGKDGSQSDGMMSLTLIHLQGPLMLLLIGLNLAAISFTLEIIKQSLSSDLDSIPQGNDIIDYNTCTDN